jgi:hypothetical protein
MGRARYVRGNVESLVGAIRRLTVYRRIGVDPARALLVDAVRRVTGRTERRVRRDEQAALDLIRSQGGACLQHQSYDACGDRRRLRGARHDEEVFIFGAELRVGRR